MALCCLLTRRTAPVICRRQCLGVSGSISITRSRGRGPLLNSTTRGTTVDQRSGGGWKEERLSFICMNKLEWIYTYLSMNLFMRAQQESHLSSRLWRSAATRWLGRSHSCPDPHWLSPGSDSSGTSSPRPPWYTKTPLGLTVFFEEALALWLWLVQNTWSTSVGQVCHPGSSPQSPSPRLEKTCEGTLGKSARCPRWSLPTVYIM